MNKVIVLFVFLNFAHPSLIYPSPVHEAASEGNFEKAKDFVDKGADINEKDENGFTPLHYATANVKLVMKPVKGFSGAYSLVPEGNIELVKFIVGKGADINAKSDDGRTSLHMSTYVGCLDVIKLLVSQGASIDIKDNSGLTVLDYTEKDINPMVPSATRKEVVQFYKELGKSKKK